MNNSRREMRVESLTSLPEESDKNGVSLQGRAANQRPRKQRIRSTVSALEEEVVVRCTKCESSKDQIDPCYHSPIPRNNSSLVDCPSSALPTFDDLPVQYKEVVIIGNGPSALSVSYILAGNWPYYNGTGHPVPYLQSKLEASSATPLVLQDLGYLSEGLEGRSSNPIAVLYDTLARPGADLGMVSNSVLSWQCHPEMAIDHAVIGKGKPGGAWQSMEGNTLTVSLGSWMELPGLPFHQWNSSRKRISIAQRQHRTTVASVAKYYTEYVNLTGIEKYNVQNSIITSIEPHRAKAKLRKMSSVPKPAHFEAAVKKHRRISAYSFASEEVAETSAPPATARPLWEVKGYQNICLSSGKVVKEPFQYVASNVVIATGSNDKPNMLDIEGEKLGFVFHALGDLEVLVRTRMLNQDSAPLLVVGAGLSAADAIIAARFYNIPVVHAFRRNVTDRNLIFNKLPNNLYPEYHKVHQMMSGPGEAYEGYKPLPRHRVMEIRPDRKVVLEDATSCKILTVSYVVILVGCSPNLFFLPRGGRGLGVKLLEDIDSRSNPIDIDPFTHECRQAEGIYALGPLVSDNFVRFVQGGALAIASDIIKKKTGSRSVACWWDSCRED